MFENIEKALTTMSSAIGVKLDGDDEQVKKYRNGSSRPNKLQLR